MKRIISKIFCNQEERSIKRDFHLHFLCESITDTCLLSSLDQFIVLIWKTDVDSRLSVGSPWTQKYFTNNLQTVNYYPITNNYVPESNSRSIFLFATNINYGSWHVWRICIPVYWEYVDGRGDIRSVRVVSCS